MVKVDLITGFLGSGKTTFIKKYVRYLLEKGEKICILENDYGAVNVDMMLLSELRNDNLGIEMVAGGYDYDCHRRRFKTKLITMAMLGYSRVIIEPSGVFDVDEFFDILHEDPLTDRYSIGSVITIVNSLSDTIRSEEEDYMLASQAAQAGLIVMSRVQQADESRVRTTLDIINNALLSIKCKRHFTLGENVIAKDWEKLEDADYEKVCSAGFTECAFEKRFSMDDNSFKSLFFMNVNLDKEALLSKIRALFNDEGAGRIFRIKGFVKTTLGWEEINAVKDNITCSRLPEGQDIIIVIGENLDESVIDAYFPSKYSTVRFR